MLARVALDGSRHHHQQHDAAIPLGSKCLMATVLNKGGYQNQPLFHIHISGTKLICIDVSEGGWMAICCASLLGRHLCTNRATQEYPAQLVSTTIALCGLNDVFPGCLSTAVAKVPKPMMKPMVHTREAPTLSPKIK